MNDLSKVVDKLQPHRLVLALRGTCALCLPREFGLQQPCRTAGASIDVPILPRSRRRRSRRGHFAGHGRHQPVSATIKLDLLDGSAFLPDRQ